MGSRFNKQFEDRKPECQILNNLKVDTDEDMIPKHIRAYFDILKKKTKLLRWSDLPARVGVDVNVDVDSCRR